MNSCQFFVHKLIVKLILLKAKDNDSVLILFILFFSTCGIEYVVEVGTFKMTNINTC